MKLSKIFTFVILVFFGAALLIVSTGCPEDPKPTEEPCSGWVDCASSCVAEDPGDLCALLTKLEEYCIIPTDEPELTQEIVQGMVDDLNAFWDALADEMLKPQGEFDPTVVETAFDEVLSAENVDALTPILLELLMGLDMTATDAALYCNDLLEIGSYISEFTGPQPDCPGESFWCEIESYVSLVGLDAATAWSILSTRVGELDDALGLTDILTQIETIGCSEPYDAFVYDWITDEASANGLEKVLYYATHPDEQTDAIWEDIIDQIAGAGGILDSTISVVVGLLGDIHEQGDSATIAGLIPTIPGLLIGFITEDMNMCEEVPE